jgi:short-subunit dehydrogenase
MNAQSVALVTGASAGIGSVIARTLARAGYRVYGTSRNPQPVPNTPFSLIELDVTDSDSVRRCVEYVRRSAGHIDVLVNNVGSLVFGSAEETPLAETISELELNFLGAVRVTQAVLPHMRERQHGRIINISSLAGRVGLPMNSASSAGKFALEGYSESLRAELLTYGVYVSLIALSATRSDGQSRSMRPTSQTLSMYNE